MSSLTSPALQADQPPANCADDSSARSGRLLFLVLCAVALVYAFLGSLRTVFDPDLGWQLATGRWIVQHHHVFSVDVFSYTAAGQPWIYPVGSGLIFYALWLMGGFALLSWAGAAACVGTVALLLRRGSAATAAIAILAIPLIVERTTPRAEMFTVILFAAYLSILWQNYQTGRARLWLLPLLMVVWVNLHLGFIAGLGLVLGFVGLELLEMPASASRRREALQRLRRAFPWYALTAPATLVNPWGWGLYRALIRQNRVMAQHSQLIVEWAQGRWHWTGSIPGFLQSPLQNSLTVLLMTVIAVACIAVWRGQMGPAFLLVAAMYESMRHVRMVALAACLIVVVTGAILSPLIQQLNERIANRRIRVIAAIAAAALFIALATVRSFDFASDHVALAGNNLMDFGTGLAWWLPQRAAEFVQHENLPGNVFNSYDIGGYVVWKLGPQYRDFIDGRAIPFGAEALPHELRLVATPLDADDWQQEADRYNINTVLLPFTSNEISVDRLQDLCQAKNWQPVYLDEVSIVLVRRKPENAQVIDRLQVNCASAPLPAEPLDHTAKSFQHWVNAADMLLVLHRNAEALAAVDNAFRIFPNSARLRQIRGNIFYASYRRTEAEQEWLTALALGAGDSAAEAAVWFSLGELYEQQERPQDALHAWQETVRLTSDKIRKPRALVKLARLYVRGGNPKAALQALDMAAGDASPVLLQPGGGRNFNFDIAQGRAAAWRGLGDIPKAISFQEQAVQIDPDAADAWLHLAKLYERQGRIADQHRAEDRARALAPAPTP